MSRLELTKWLVAVTVLGFCPLRSYAQDPLTEALPWELPYNGYLERDGQPFTGSETIGFGVHQGVSESPSYFVCLDVLVSAGAFSAVLPQHGDWDVSGEAYTEGAGDELQSAFEQAVSANEPLSLSIRVLGDSDCDPTAGAELANRQQLYPGAFSLAGATTDGWQVTGTLSAPRVDATVVDADRVETDRVETGNLVIGTDEASGSATIHGTLTAAEYACPPDTDRVGPWCISGLRQPGAGGGDWLDASVDCWEDRLQLCPRNALLACVELQPEGTDCDTEADAARDGREATWFWTAESATNAHIVDDVDLRSGGWGGNFGMPGNGTSWEADWSTKSSNTDFGYFCCITR